MIALHRPGIRCALLLLFALLGALQIAPASAEDKCPATLHLDKLQTPTASLGKPLTLHIDGLPAAGCSPSGYRLRLDGYTLGLLPKLDDMQNQNITFQLARLDADRASWSAILGAPPIDGTKPVAVSLELPDKSVATYTGESPPVVNFVVFYPLQLIFGAAIAITLAFVVLSLGASTGLLRDADPDIADATERSFSLGRCQMAFWFVLLTVGFIMICTITWDYDGILTSQSLVLLGISGTTALGAISIDASKPKSGAMVHKNFWWDILTDASGPVLQRLQVVVWTLVLGVISIVSIYRNLSLPKFDDTLLAMAGISSGLYIGFKWPEKPT